MGRRSVHTPEELRQLILDAARSIVERDGLVGLSAREVARLIGYSAGTLYNIFENLDDVLLTLQSELLVEFVERLKTVKRDPNPYKRVDALARCYVDFALEKRRLWNLLCVHPLPKGKSLPAAFDEAIGFLTATLAEALEPILPPMSPAEARQRAQTLWAGIHGITLVAVGEKVPAMTQDTAQDYVAILTKTFLAGLKTAKA
jgi:AcrR family transcriptional regulator